MRFLLPLLGLLLLVSTSAKAAGNRNYDVLHVDLQVDVTTQQAIAMLTLRNDDPRNFVTLMTGSLVLASVEDAAGNPVAFVSNPPLTRVAAGFGINVLTFSYQFQQPTTQFPQGAAANGDARYTYTWPDHCGNLFPCDPHISEGFSYSLDVQGVPAGQTAIYATDSVGEGPPYMLAWSVADYVTRSLGTTANGTELLVAYLRGNGARVQRGTAELVTMFEFFEDTYGPYHYGDRAGAVETVGSYGGIEHHPFWHLDWLSMGDPETQAHEASHGWFGNGVRPACWEDMVLSEGFADYLAGRAIEHAYGQARGDDYWAELITDANHPVLPLLPPQIVWGQACTTDDAELHYGTPTYVKGAMFLYSLEGAIGRGSLDHAMAVFYQANRGQAARFDDFLQTVLDETGFDALDCAEAWLRSTTVPATYDCTAP